MFIGKMSKNICRFSSLCTYIIIIMNHNPILRTDKPKIWDFFGTFCGDTPTFQKQGCYSVQPKLTYHVSLSVYSRKKSVTTLRGDTISNDISGYFETNVYFRMLIKPSNFFDRDKHCFGSLLTIPKENLLFNRKSLYQVTN